MLKNTTTTSKTSSSTQNKTTKPTSSSSGTKTQVKLPETIKSTTNTQNNKKLPKTNQVKPSSLSYKAATSTQASSKVKSKEEKKINETPATSSVLDKDSDKNISSPVIPKVFAIQTRENRYKTPHLLYNRAHYLSLRIRRAYLRRFTDFEHRLTRNFLRYFPKQLTNIHKETVENFNKYSKINKLLCHKSQWYMKERCKNSSMIEKADVEIINARRFMKQLNNEMHYLKNLKNVRICHLYLDIQKDFSLAMKLLKRWRFLNILCIKFSADQNWSYLYWKNLAKLIRDDLKTLNLDIGVDVRGVSNYYFNKFIDKFIKSSVSCISLTLSVDGYQTLIEFFKRCEEFKSINSLKLKIAWDPMIGGYFIPNNLFKIVCSSILEKMKHLKSLHLDFSNEANEGYCIMDEELNYLCKVISEMKDMVEIDLNLSNFDERLNNIGDTGLKSVTKMALELRNLEILSLDLGYNSITRNGAENILKYLEKVEKLKKCRLRLVKNRIEDGELEQAIFKLKERCKAELIIAY